MHCSGQRPAGHSRERFACGVLTGGFPCRRHRAPRVVRKTTAGTLPAQQGQQSKGQASRQKTEKDLKSTASRAEKQRDAYLLSDLLGTEKYVSGVYNTAVFEFSDAKARQVLAAIQQQEQEHGKQLSDYMQANNMYC